MKWRYGTIVQGKIKVMPGNAPGRKACLLNSKGIRDLEFAETLPFFKTKIMINCYDLSSAGITMDSEPKLINLLFIPCQTAAMVQFSTIDEAGRSRFVFRLTMVHQLPSRK